MPDSKAVTADPAARDAQAARQARRSALRTNSAAICVMLLVQYGLGMGVDLNRPETGPVPGRLDERNRQEERTA